MKNNKNILIILLVVVVGALLAIQIFATNKENNPNSNNKDSEFEKLDVSTNKFTIVKDDDNILDLIYNGKELEQFMTVANSERNVNINLIIDSNSEINEVYIINKSNGEKMYFEDGENSTKSITTKLNPNDDYGVTINGVLVGAIRAVDNFEEADIDIIKMDMFLNMKCGL